MPVRRRMPMRGDGDDQGTGRRRLRRDALRAGARMGRAPRWRSARARAGPTASAATTASALCPESEAGVKGKTIELKVEHALVLAGLAGLMGRGLGKRGATTASQNEPASLSASEPEVFRPGRRSDKSRYGSSRFASAVRSCPRSSWDQDMDEARLFATTINALEDGRRRSSRRATSNIGRLRKLAAET